MTRLVRAPNPGPMTLEGTNTWLVGGDVVLVVDPGPADAGHLGAVLEEVGRDGGRLGGVLLTHRHPDHAEALDHPRLRQALADAAAPVLALDPALGRAPRPDLLATTCDVACEVLPLPGHTDDSLALVLPAAQEVLTGDTVLGRGTSVVAHPDGDLTAYLASLDALAALTGSAAGSAQGAPWTGLPGHGPVLPDLGGAVAVLRRHRLDRVDQVLAALAGHPAPDPADGPLVDRLVAAVYPGLDDPVLRQAAARTVRATLVHLGRAAGDP